MPRKRKRDRGTAKPFLCASELADLTPLSESAIYTMVSRGVLKRGVHFHKVVLPGRAHGRQEKNEGLVAEGGFSPNAAFSIIA